MESNLKPGSAIYLEYYRDTGLEIPALEPPDWEEIEDKYAFEYTDIGKWRCRECGLEWWKFYKEPERCVNCGSENVFCTISDVEPSLMLNRRTGAIICD